MRFTAASLGGAFLIEPEPNEDHRGSFARTYCAREFAAHGINVQFVQCNTSFNIRRGTIRGMHFQHDPKPEPKLVRCTRGAAWDVILDLRPDSPTYCKWQAFELTGNNRSAVYVPPGFAHGFQTLEDETELFYQMGEFYEPPLAGGVRWNDPVFHIDWPIADAILSERDNSYPDFRP